MFRLLTFILSISLFAGCSTTNPHALEYIGPDYDGNVPSTAQEDAATGVIQRLLGKNIANNFAVEVVPAKGPDYFEVLPRDGKIVLRGSNGVSACRGLKWYLNTKCHCSITWNGDNLVLPENLPMDFAPHREETPYTYRYIFNNCIYGYSMAWWHWEEWERMLDVLAFNGINMPAMLLGQEKIWQETYKEFGLSASDLENYFAGPAWYPWQWMGNLDGWGGPLPQSVIDGQCELQKHIVNRARALGMKTVLPGFSGHIPAALIEKNPDLKYHTMEWWGFGPNYTLDWQDSLFVEIGRTYLEKQREYYGTDHYYNIDPFNEMMPPRSDKEYLTQMARTIYRSIEEADEEGIWVLMTWFAKIPTPERFWTPDRTKDFFDVVPNDKILALELAGEKLSLTGWYRQSGWYGKPWVWCILQNFGNRVDIYGGLDQIFENYHRMQDSPERGNISGLGIMTEGLGFNPVVYELVLDMMWGDGVQDLDQWKQDYLIKRYGSAPESVQNAWKNLYENRYNRVDLVSISPLVWAPALLPAFEPDLKMIETWTQLLDAADKVEQTPAYRFDLVNTGREAMGEFFPYYTIKVKEAFDARDIAKYQKARADLLQYLYDYDRLLGTNEEFLLGRWLEGARSWGADAEEKALMEWGAKRQITDWGGRIGSYAIKEWAGMATDRMLPAWELYLTRMEESMQNNIEFDTESCTKEIDELLKAWPHRHSYLPTRPTEDAVTVSREMWNKYYRVMMDYTKTTGYVDLSRNELIKGMAFDKPVECTSQEDNSAPEFSVDGKLSGKYWGAVAPASLTVDLEKPSKVAAFHIYPYRDGRRYYQYTIEISVDGKNWMQVVDMNHNTEIASIKGHYHPFNAGYDFRYARLNMLKNSVNPSVHVIEFKILSAEDAAKLITPQ